MKRVDLLTLAVTNEGVPFELFGFDNSLLSDLSWLGPAWPQYQNVGWWPEVYPDGATPEYTRVVGETYQADAANKVVKITYTLQPWSSEEIAADKAAKVNVFIDCVSSIAQNRLDAFAKSRKYDNILSACTYALGNDPEFKAEGLRCVHLKEQTWRTLYDTMEGVKAGVISMPATIDDIPLPALTWESDN